jgi:hypothetical protein
MTANQAYDALAYYYPEQAAWWDDLEPTPFHTNPSPNVRATKFVFYNSFYTAHRDKIFTLPDANFGPLYKSQHHLMKGLALASKAHPVKFQEVFEGVHISDNLPAVANAVILQMLCFKNRQEQKRLTAEHKAAVKKMKE